MNGKLWQEEMLEGLESDLKRYDEVHNIKEDKIYIGDGDKDISERKSDIEELLNSIQDRNYENGATKGRIKDLKNALRNTESLVGEKWEEEIIDKERLVINSLKEEVETYWERIEKERIYDQTSPVIFELKKEMYKTNLNSLKTYVLNKEDRIFLNLKDHLEEGKENFRDREFINKYSKFVNVLENAKNQSEEKGFIFFKEEIEGKLNDLKEYIDKTSPIIGRDFQREKDQLEKDVKTQILEKGYEDTIVNILTETDYFSKNMAKNLENARMDIKTYADALKDPEANKINRSSKIRIDQMNNTVKALARVSKDRAVFKNSQTLENRQMLELSLDNLEIAATRVFPNIQERVEQALIKENNIDRK